MRHHPLPIAIITYAVMTLIIYLFCSVEAAGQKNTRNMRPIPWYYDYPYRGKLTVEYLLPQEVHTKCRHGQQLPSSVRILACAYPAWNDKGRAADDISYCHLVLPLDIGFFSEEENLYLTRHELAHCNGWPSDHTYDLLWRGPSKEDREAIELWVIKRSMQ